MTIGQYLLVFFGWAAIIVGVMVFATGRAKLRGLISVSAAFVLAAGLFFALRQSNRGNPRAALISTFVAAVAVATGAVIVWLRMRNGTPRNRILTATLAWVGLAFAWFETAYLLR